MAFAGGFDMKNFVKLSISGIDETLENFVMVRKKTRRMIAAEVNRLGREMLSDLKARTPVVTGRLKRSAYWDRGDQSDDMLTGTLGYRAEYAAEVEMRRGMLATTLEEWRDEYSERLIQHMYKSLG